MPSSPLALLLLASVGLPALLGGMWPARRIRPVIVGLAPWAAAPALLVALIHLYDPSGVPEVQVLLLFTGLEFGLDGPGGALLLLTALLWMAGGAYARSYHAGDPHRDRFFTFFALTMTGNLGLVMAADLLSFYLFFAVMTFSAYGLIVHHRNEEAARAGRVYIVMALVGEVALLAGVLQLAAAGRGDVGFGAELASAWRGIPGSTTLVGALLAAGFGVKAGLVPLHLWLPLAHPVAPTAASALLSGVMIKAGLLGWLRILPEASGLPGVGGALIVLGLLSAFYGVLVGMVQRDSKTILAYSSVSQMGLMSIGTGLLLLTPDPEPMVLAAVVIYALHHGLAKGALFLSVGIADRMGEPSRRARPFFLVAAVVPALALAGAPLTSGALAKAILKDPMARVGAGWYPILDPLLLLAAAGTTLLMVRFLVSLRTRARNASAEGERGDEIGITPWGLVVPWAALVIAGALAPLWLMLAQPLPLGEVRPGALAGFWSALLPVVAGVGLAWGVMARPRLLAPAAGIRIPPGDLIVFLEVAARKGSAVSQRALPARLGIDTGIAAGLWDRGRAMAKGLAARDLLFTRGIVVGFLLLGLIGLLAGALLSAR